MKKYTVYQIKHIVTGQILYIGKTRNFKKRAYQHLTLKTNTKDWLSSIGTNNVTIEAVAEFNDKTEALKYEDELILKYNTITNGYNKYRSGLIYIEDKEKYRREYEKTYKRKEYLINYRQTDEYKEYKKEYYSTEKYKEKIREHHKTDEYKEWLREYRKTDKIKKYMKEYNKEYQRTEKYKEKKREYSKTDKYKEYQKDYKKAKKLGISVSEYRKLKNDQGATLEQNKKQPIQLTINFN